MANVGLGLVLALVAGTTALEQFQLRVERVQRQRPPKPEVPHFGNSNLSEFVFNISSNTKDRGLWHFKPEVVQLSTQARLTNVNDVLYTIEAKVGTPPAPAQLVVDTGSSDLWIKQTVLFSNSGAKLPSNLPVWRMPDGSVLVREIVLRYGLGTVLAIPLIEKRLCIGQLCVKNQDVLAAMKIIDVSSVARFDGLIGLALPVGSQNSFSNVTFLQRLQMQHSSSFALSLSQNGGSLAFGGLDELLHRKRAHKLQVYARSNGLSLWIVSLGFQLTEKQSGKLMLKARGYGALDSGSSLLVLPQPLYAAALTELLPPNDCQQAGYTIVCPCDTDLNVLSLTVPSDGGLQVSFGKEELLTPQDADGMVCMLNIMSMPPAEKGLPFMILGDVFLRKVYAVFDPVEPAVWLASNEEEAVFAAMDLSNTTMIAGATIAAVVAAVMVMVVALLRGQRSPQDVEYMQL
mmetsp:Transcript_819/g.1858  ORF Transcript_819/g.1858 Transcript_819/m.1858 type:complete len:460 (-) Transcript_819:44-1423(-)